MLEWLFNYPATTWREASLGFDHTWSALILIGCIATALLLVGVSLFKAPIAATRRVTLFVLQGLIASVVLIMIWQPVLKLEIAEQGENTVAWVVDVSASMQTEDIPAGRDTTTNLQSRLDAAVSVVEELALDSSAEFEAAIYAQGSVLERVTSTQSFQSMPMSSLTNLAGGVDELLGTVGESALAAVVLLSDGSNNAGAMDAQWWQRISAAGVPVHTVGVGRLSDPADIQLSDVILPEQVAENVQYTARLKINHSRGGSARLRVFNGNDLLAVQDIELPDGLEESIHKVSLPSRDKGISQLRFEVRSSDPLMDPELANNDQSRIVRVTDSPKRILYVEGEPRWEYKFLRRALDTHPDIDIVSLLRTSPNKFYRQGVRDAKELAEGFPERREDLFSYDAVIIGSMEAAELNTEQQLALRDFVSVRGGSLLMLAGRHGLADGGWGRSVVAAALPVILDARLATDTFDRVRAKAMPTVSGLRTSWLALADSQDANAQAWAELPDIADVQNVGSVKPGAMVLLDRMTSDASDPDSSPLLVSQRYGKGQSLVLGTSGTWRWQMGLDSSDQRHETFWRQLVGHLVESVVARVSVVSAASVYRDVDIASLSLNVYNANYEPFQQASLPVQLSLPDGSQQTVELQANMQQPGNYIGDVTMPLDGPYTVNAMAPLGGESSPGELTSAEYWWVRESDTAESFDNIQRVDLLKRIADATGGSYLPLSEAQKLADVLTRSNAALKREVSLPLWNMPVLFFLLILVKATEWLLRLRWKRL